MNNNNNGQTIHKNHADLPKKEKTLLEIFRLLIKNKYLIFGSMLFFITVALIYSFTAEPNYEAISVLKKESNPENNRVSPQDISTMINLQSLDEIETEMKLINTHTVMSKVVTKLGLNVNINQVKWGKSKSYKVEKNILETLDPAFITKTREKYVLPEYLKVDFSNPDNPVSGDFIVTKLADEKYSIFSVLLNKKLAESQILESNNSSSDSSVSEKDNSAEPNTNAKVSTRDLIIEISWNDAPIGSELYLSLIDFPEAVQNANKKTKVAREGKTDVFSISYASNSAYAAAVITNEIVDEFRESRMQQKKEAIRYSFDFVDKQLNEIQEKLKGSEGELSRFKSSGQIMTIDASSQELIGFLSSLEAEKLSTDLQLSDYKNKAADLEKELKKSGFFDQGYLNPQGQNDGNSPFSQLMKQLTDQEVQRLELLQKRTENHPDVVAINEQINQTKSSLKSYNENTLTAYNIMINTLEKKLLKINDLMSKYEVKMQGLPSQENRLAQLLREKGTYEKIFTILLDQRESMRIAELSRMQDITIVDEAKIPQDPSWPKKSLIVLVSTILGAFIGIFLVFFVELYRTRFVNLDELETEFQIPILSIIPKYSNTLAKEIKNSKLDYKIATLISNDNGLTETYRLFRTKLNQRLDHENKMIMITSCEENTGKTSVAANLAVSLSQEGKRVLLVDCDLRKGDLSKMFGITSKETGMIDFLTKDVNPKIYSRASKLIEILPAGGYTEDSGTLLNSPKMKKLFSHLTSSGYDMIIFDTPPVTRVVDPLVLAQFIKDVIIVVRPNLSLIETVRWGIQELNQANVKIKGIVANAANIETSYYYRYKYGYGYGYGKENGRNSKSQKDNIITEKKTYS